MKRYLSVAIYAIVLLLTCLSLVFCHSCSVRAVVPYDGSSYADSLVSFLKKPGLKVLDIGNSYTNDALELLPQVVAAVQELVPVPALVPQQNHWSETQPFPWPHSPAKSA